MNKFKIFLGMLVFLGLSLSVESQTWPPADWQGNGTSSNPWEIRSAKQLKDLAEYLNTTMYGYYNGDNTRGKYFKLMNDINLSSYPDWDPIGNNCTNSGDSRFQGFFDGNGKVIRNLTINHNSSYGNGFFGVTYHSNITNLGIENCNISNPTGMAGGLVAYSESSTISNCYVTGRITGNGNGNVGTGGITGYSDCSTINNCWVNVTILGARCAGGIAGYNIGYAGHNARILNCIALGTVKANDWIGGIVGNNAPQNYGIVGNCIAANDSIIALSATSYINRVAGKSDYYSLIGGTYYNNYALDNIVMIVDGFEIISNNVGDSGKTKNMNELKNISFYTTSSNWYMYPWSIDSPYDTWKICDKQDFPFLRWQGIRCYYNITASTGTNGNINPSGVSVLENTNQTFVFTPNPCHEVDSLWIDGVYAPDSMLMGSYTFKNITGNHTIMATFKHQKYINNIFDVICSDIPYYFAGKKITTSGIYHDTLQNANGCDSVVVCLILTEKKVSAPILKLLNFKTYFCITWQATNPTIYEIYRNDSLLAANIKTTRYLDYDLTSDITYCYKIRAIDGKCESDFSETICETFNNVGIVGANGIRPEIQVYPNPAGNQLTIECRDGARPVPTVEIYSVVGQKLMQLPCRDVINHVSTINVEHLANGMYFLKIDNKMVRFVKE